MSITPTKPELSPVRPECGVSYTYLLRLVPNLFLPNLTTDTRAFSTHFGKKTTTFVYVRERAELRSRDRAGEKICGEWRRSSLSIRGDESKHVTARI